MNKKELIEAAKAIQKYCKNQWSEEMILRGMSCRECIFYSNQTFGRVVCLKCGI